MAVNIEFTGFVNGVRTFDWGVVYDVAHAQMMKDDQGDWKVAGKDYFSVTGPNGFVEGDMVKVVGTLKTKSYEKKDGTKGIALNVRAKDMEKAERRSGGGSGADAVAQVFNAPGLDLSAPF
jgi:hypothetical protein